MYKGFFSYLNWLVPKVRSPSSELTFINANQGICPVSRRTFLDFSSPYGIRRSYILLRSMKRRNRVISILKSSTKDEIILHQNEIKRIWKGMPSFSYHQTPIYFPFYSPFINQRFLSSLDSFYSFPYDAFLRDPDCSLINPFHEYGSHLFDRSLTKRKKLDVSDIDSSAYYREKDGILFFIDSSGYLETRVPFFDDGRKQKNTDHLKERLEAVARDYYSNNFPQLSQDLIQFELLSPNVVLAAIKNKEAQYKEKQEDDF